MGLAVCAYAPLHRLLRPERTGLAGLSTRTLAEGLWQQAIWGTVIVGAMTVALTRLVPSDPWAVLAPLGRRLERVPGRAWALTVGLVGFLLAIVAARGLFAGLPTSVDSMVLLAHARALVEGSLSLPLPGEPAAWIVQNSVPVDGGMASVYPPGHVAALAAGLALGAPWVVGPAAVGVLAAFSFLAIERVAPDRALAARLAGLAVALSPFVWSLGGSHLSHTTAAAAAAVLAWAVLKARDGHAGWAFLAGGCAGALVCIRPWTGLALAGALVGGAWLPATLPGERPAGWLGARLGRLAVAGVPGAAVLLGWNASLFGSPGRLGYSVGFGPAHGLGFHADPWGNRYGVVEALAYSGADLVQLGMALFETPLPAVAVVAAALLTVSAGTGRRILWAWALAPVAANALYWHHGQHLGPRMLFEAAPAWAALTVLALADASRLPRLRRVSGWVTLVSVCGALLLLPSRIRSLEVAGGVVEASRLPRLPEPSDRPTLLLVHGSWSARIAARLSAAGMRRDSIETALRRNDACVADRYARWRGAGAEGSPPPLDTEPLPGIPERLEERLLSRGNRILLDPAAVFDEACRREATSDRLGTVELEPLLWQAPPLQGSVIVVARDLGPVANERVTRLFGGYRVLVIVDGGEGAPLRLVRYEEGMELLWRGAAAFTEVGR